MDALERAGPYVLAQAELVEHLLLTGIIVA
jgi:hypothetical protein